MTTSKERSGWLAPAARPRSTVGEISSVWVGQPQPPGGHHLLVVHADVGRLELEGDAGLAEDAVLAGVGEHRRAPVGLGRAAGPWWPA